MSGFADMLFCDCVDLVCAQLSVCVCVSAVNGRQSAGS